MVDPVSLVIFSSLAHSNSRFPRFFPLPRFLLLFLFFSLTHSLSFHHFFLLHLSILLFSSSLRLFYPTYPPRHRNDTRSSPSSSVLPLPPSTSPPCQQPPNLSLNTRNRPDLPILDLLLPADLDFVLVFTSDTNLESS